MDFRKIIKFGTSSHIISLPKDWLQKHKLKKGDIIYYEQNGNDELVLAPTLPKEAEELRITINLDTINEEEIQRLIVSKYLGGYDVFTITWKGNLEPQNKIRSIIQDLMAIEIVEQTGNRIIAKDFINHKDISLPLLIRRMDTIVRSMFEDVTTIFKDNYQNLYDRDKDINKINKLCLRTIRKAITDPYLKRRFNIDDEELINIRDIIFFVEFIGDNIKRIGRYLNQATINEQQLKKFKTLLTTSYTLYTEAMKAFYKKDEKVGYAIAARKDPFIEEANVLIEEIEDINGAYAIEKLKEIVVLIRNIARITYQNPTLPKPS